MPYIWKWKVWEENTKQQLYTGIHKQKEITIINNALQVKQKRVIVSADMVLSNSIYNTELNNRREQIKLSITQHS